MNNELASVLSIESLDDPDFIHNCQRTLDSSGALVVENFFAPDAIATVLEQSACCEADAYYASSTHNVYLTPCDPQLPAGHAYNRQVISSKGLIADDQIPADSPLRVVYNAPEFRSFLSAILGIEQVFSYADDLSSINVHFAPAGKELGWHFDNSSFAVTMLLQAAAKGGRFQYVANTRDTNTEDMGFEKVAAVLDGTVPVTELDFKPGDLVLFRGRDSMHRVTPTAGDTTRVLVVFAYNSDPGLGLSDSALQTFYGRSRVG